MSDMNMGDVSRRLGVTVTSELLDELGIKIIQGKGRARFVAESQWPAVCDAVADYILSRKGASTPPKPAAKVKIDPPAPVGASNTALPFDEDDDEL